MFVKAKNDELKKWKNPARDYKIGATLDVILQLLIVKKPFFAQAITFGLPHGRYNVRSQKETQNKFSFLFAAPLCN